MNRRQLFGWLTALPFVPVALAKIIEPKPVGTVLNADLIRRAKAILTSHAVPEPYYLQTSSELWVIGDRTTEVWTDDHSWLYGDQWTPAQQAVLKRRPLPAGVYRDGRGRFTHLNMKYKPNLPAWF